MSIALAKPLSSLNSGSHSLAAMGLLGLLAVSSNNGPLADTLSENAFLRDMPVVLSATRLQQPLVDAPVAMTVIDRQLIDLSGAQNIPDLLRFVPGIQVGQVRGSRSTVTYHGLSDEFARNMQVLVDGRSVYDPGYGGVPWFDLPLAMDDIQRIEVIRGPNSPTYGANAFSATINIITRHPSEDPGTFLRGTIGSAQTRRLVARHAGAEGKLDYRVTASYGSNTGIITRFDDSRTRFVDAKGVYRLNPGDALELGFGYNDGPRQDGFPTDLDQPERTLRHDYHYESLQFTRTVSADEELKLKFYHNDLDHQDPFESPPFSALLGELGLPSDPWLLPWPDQTLQLDLSVHSHRYDLEFQHTLRPHEDWRLVWGLGGRYDTAEGAGLFGPNKQAERGQLRAFLNNEWKIQPAWMVNLGMMVEQYEGYGLHLSPRLALAYHLSDTQSVRLSATEAIRMPSLLEEFADWRIRFQDGSTFDYVGVAGDDLKPEKIRSYELGYVGSYPRYGLTVDLKAYRDEIRDILWAPLNQNYLVPPLVGLVPPLVDVTQGAFISGNEGYVNVNGWETSLSYRPTRKTILRLGYSYADAEGRELRLTNPDQYRPLDGHIPTKTWSVLLGHEFPRHIEASLAYYNVGTIDWRGEGNLLPGYHRLDMRLAKGFDLGGAKGKAALVWQNIDNRYQDFQMENWADSRAFLELSIAF